MSDAAKQLVLIDSDVLPEIFLKVLEAKKLLKSGKAKNSSEACRLTGISRSAFYKYKDSVRSYEDGSSKKIITLYMTLADEPGVLSAVLTCLYGMQANIVTVNQNIPAESVATTTISIRINQKKIRPEEIVEPLSMIDGVIEIKRI